MKFHRVNKVKKIVVLNLNIATQILLKRMKPEVIAITGSAGKTTTKEILSKILSTEFDVLASKEGYNTEIGAPLTIFCEKTPKNTKSIISWLKIIFKCYVRSISIKKYPEKLIMEFGADSPGDIKYLANLFKPEKGIVLTVLPVHLEKMKNIENIAKEKGELAIGVRKGGMVFLNHDNQYTKEMSTKEGVEVVTFGKDKSADFVASNIKSDISGLSFKLLEGGKEQDISVRLYGSQMIYPLIAAVSVARKDHISYKKIKSALKEVSPFKGRMNVLEGINESMIIDDSYNANPESVLGALDFLCEQKGRKIALLGNMNELGDFAKEGHEIVGRKAAETVDFLFTVGDFAEKYLISAAIQTGLNKKAIKSFGNAKEAGDYLKKFLKPGDILLAKGSQNNVRLEKALEIIIKDQDKKRDILVRQGDEWKNR